MELIQDAIELGKTLTFQYYAPSGNAEREVETYFLIFKWSSRYIYGYCLLRNDYRMFKLNRMTDILQSTELTDFSFEGTIFRYGEQSYDVTTCEEAINCILSADSVGKKIVIKCHVGPMNGVYCIFDTVSEAFETNLYGSYLIWHSDNITTGVYVFWSDIYTYDGEIVKSYALADGNYIYDLAYSDNYTKLKVTILCDDGTEQIDIIEL